MCVRVGSEESNGKPIAKVNETEQDSADQIHASSQPEKCGQYTDRNQQATVEDDLAPGFPAAAVHRESCACVVFSEDPCDRKKVRHLPEKQNREERKRNRIDFAARGCP